MADDLEFNENLLVKRLKRLYCNLDGNEVLPEESAELLHQLGQIYLKRGKSLQKTTEYKSPGKANKLCLIQSAVLLNAAIAREPSNVNEIKKDLRKLCSFVLEESRADKTQVDLIKIAIDVKTKIEGMRSYVEAQLNEMKKTETLDSRYETSIQLENQIIDKMQKIQKEISKKYTNIMSEITKKCEEVMGKNPCKYAVAGMGSLARKEITPYSDFEHCIVLEDGVQNDKKTYGEIKRYFRRLSLIFNIIIINLGETIIPSVCIPTLNDAKHKNGDWFYDSVGSKGISFDGFQQNSCKFPLGEQLLNPKSRGVVELIKPVSEMVKYIVYDEKSQYDLSENLSKTCFVSGDEDVYNSFLWRVSDRISSQREKNPNFFKVLKVQIRHCKEEFNMDEDLFRLHIYHELNLKYVIYRGITAYLSAIGTFKNIKAASCFDIVSELYSDNVLINNYAVANANDASIHTDEQLDLHKLHYAIAVACKIRLGIYMKKKAQDDWIIHKTKSVTDQSDLLGVIDGKSIASCIETTLILQESMLTFIKKNVTHILKSTFINNPIIVPMIYWQLHLHDMCIKSCESKLEKVKEELRGQSYEECDDDFNLDEYSSEEESDSDNESEDQDKTENQDVNRYESDNENEVQVLRNNTVDHNVAEAWLLVLIGLSFFYEILDDDIDYQKFEKFKSFRKILENQIICEKNSVEYFRSCIDKISMCTKVLKIFDKNFKRYIPESSDDEEHIIILSNMLTLRENIRCFRNYLKKYTQWLQVQVVITEDPKLQLENLLNVIDIDKYTPSDNTGDDAMHKDEKNNDVAAAQAKPCTRSQLVGDLDGSMHDNFTNAQTQQPQAGHKRTPQKLFCEHSPPDKRAR